MLLFVFGPCVRLMVSLHLPSQSIICCTGNSHCVFQRISFSLHLIGGRGGAHRGHKLRSFKLLSFFLHVSSLSSSDVSPLFKQWAFCNLLYAFIRSPNIEHTALSTASLPAVWSPDPHVSSPPAFELFLARGHLPHPFFISKSDPFCVTASDGMSLASSGKTWSSLPDHVLWMFLFFGVVGVVRFPCHVCQLGFVACTALRSEVHWVTSHMLQVYLLYTVMHIFVPACSQPGSTCLESTTQWKNQVCAHECQINVELSYGMCSCIHFSL